MELANHGTLYLADFEEAGREVLERVDRSLADKTIIPGGGTETIGLDIRLIASTSIPVEELALRGNVPAALLKTLERGIVRIPPLREHIGDVPLLVQHFLQEANKERKKPLRGFTPSALSALEKYEWPGNVRELRDLVRAVAGKKRQGTMVDATDIPPGILYRSPRTPPPTS